MNQALGFRSLMQLNYGDRDWSCAHVEGTNKCIKLWIGNLLDIYIDFFV